MSDLRQAWPAIPEGLLDGAPPAQLSELSGVRRKSSARIRDAHEIPVDPRYQSRTSFTRVRETAVCDTWL